MSSSIFDLPAVGGEVRRFQVPLGVERGRRDPRGGHLCPGGGRPWVATLSGDGEGDIRAGWGRVRRPQRAVGTTAEWGGSACPFPRRAHGQGGRPHSLGSRVRPHSRLLAPMSVSVGLRGVHPVTTAQQGRTCCLSLPPSFLSRPGSCPVCILSYTQLGLVWDPHSSGRLQHPASLCRGGQRPRTGPLRMTRVQGAGLCRT